MQVRRKKNVGVEVAVGDGKVRWWSDNQQTQMKRRDDGIDRA